MRRLLATIATALTALLVLTACGSLSPAHHSWKNRVAATDGVTHVWWNYYNGWPTSGERYTAIITVSPDMTVAEAQKLAEKSCKGSVKLNDLKIETGSHLSEGKVARAASNWLAELANLEADCNDEGHIVTFAQVLAVLHELDAKHRDFGAEIRISQVENFRGADAGQDTPLTRYITAETTEVETLFALLSKMADAVTEEMPLFFLASVDGDASLITNFGETIELTLPNGFKTENLKEITELLKSAYLIPNRGVTFDPMAGISVTVLSPEVITSKEAEALSAEATRLGVALHLEVVAPSHLKDEEAARWLDLVETLHALAGVTRLELPGQYGSDATTIFARDKSALKEIVEAVARAGEMRGEFYIETVGG